MGSLSAELAQSEQLLNQLRSKSQQHASLADKVQALYIDNAQAGSYMQPFDTDLEGYSIRDNESHESYCNRLLKAASELRDQATKEAKQASEVQEADIPQIVCDFQCGQRRRTPSMKRPNPFGGMSPFTEPPELRFPES